jgi:hypothetical protein
LTLRKLLTITLGLVFIVSLVSIWFYPAIQDFMLANPFWNGLRDFSRESGVEWAESLAAVSENPESTTLIAIPYTRYDREDLEAIESFVQGGGLLVLLDDYGYGNEVLEAMGLGVRFIGLPLLDPLYAYKNAWLPRITDFDAGLSDAGIRAVVLNHATALAGLESPQVMAWSSETSFLDSDGSGEFDEGEPRGPFAIAAVLQLGRGTVVLVSDPSIMVNSMFGRDDNRAFLAHLIGQHDTGSVLLDVSHLSRTPLDQSKLRLDQARERIAHPYSVAALLGVVVLLALPPWTRRNPS